MKARRTLSRKAAWKTAVLASVLSVSLLFSGCGSLARILEQPNPPRENQQTAELTNQPRLGEEFEGIKVLHGSREEPASSPDRNGYFYEERGWIYLHIEGEPYTRGYQYGWLLADYIQLNIRHSIKLLDQLYAIDWEYLRQHAESMWTDVIGEEYKTELEGIVAGATARGASFDYLDLLVLNGLEELQYCWFPTVAEAYYAELTGAEPPSEDDLALASLDGQTDAAAEAAEAAHAAGVAGAAGAADAAGTTDAAANAANAADAADAADVTAQAEQTDAADQATASTSAAAPANTQTGLTGAMLIRQASAFMATGEATEDGGIILAHNTLAFYAEASFANIIVDIEPAAGQRFSMQAQPGCIAAFGEIYASQTLLIANTRIVGFNVYEDCGTPEFLRARQAVQYARTLEEFTAALLTGNNGGLASSWLVGELKTNKIMKLELGLGFYTVTNCRDGYLISTDAVEDAYIRNFETNASFLPDIRESSAARLERLKDLIEPFYGSLTAENVQVIISDHFDVFTSRAQASSRSVCAHYELDDASNSANPASLPHLPYGSVDAKVITSAFAEEQIMLARWGSGCGRSFDSRMFLSQNPQYEVLDGFLYDRPARLWDFLYPLDED